MQDELCVVMSIAVRFAKYAREGFDVTVAVLVLKLEDFAEAM